MHQKTGIAFLLKNTSAALWWTEGPKSATSTTQALCHLSFSRTTINDSPSDPLKDGSWQCPRCTRCAEYCLDNGQVEGADEKENERNKKKVKVSQTMEKEVRVQLLSS